jgi:glycyl-tRNA synthetase beta chain
MPDLLIELFSEEIPARMQARARDDLRRMVTDGLVEAGLTYASAGAFSTPRRLTLTIEGLTAESRPVREERKGPRADAPAVALEGFLRSTGLTRDQLELRDDKKAQIYFAVVEKPGRPAADIVAQVLEGAVRNFPWPKSMRWGDGTLRWVRPLQSILCLLTDDAGATVVPVTVDHLTAGNTTEGHRFMGPILNGSARFPVSSFDDYRAKLLRAKVMLDSAEREVHIWNDATNAAFAVGGTVVPDAALLTEVAGLVEWPVVLMGQIGADFLTLPPEVLQTSMREHQKFFSVKNAAGQIDRFVTVANIAAPDHGATILQGNQKVLSARLSDARFFWDNDLRVAKAGMGEWLEGLKSVTFHNKLGSQSDRVARIAALAREIAPMVGADPALAEQAATLAKADLRSAMVGEFPELQGIMGMYYAREAGLPEAVALAARDHYSPLGPSDAVPTEPVSVAVALADKFDMLGDFWAIEETPTGSKDPYALRRAGLGFIRLGLMNSNRLELLKLFRTWVKKTIVLSHSHGSWESDVVGSDPVSHIVFLGSKAEEKVGNEEPVSFVFERFLGTVTVVQTDTGTEVRRDIRWDVVDKTAQDLLTFLHDRLKVFLKDEGIRHDVIDACLAMPNNDDLTLLVKRARALQATLQTDDGANLIQGFKRANNILTQAEQKDGVEYSYGADPKFAETDEERALFTALDTAEALIAPAMKTEDFTTAMSAMATLRTPIDAFFNATQINADNPIIRRNRLNLLHRIRHLCGQVADLTKLDG